MKMGWEPVVIPELSNSASVVDESPSSFRTVNDLVLEAASAPDRSDPKRPNVIEAYVGDRKPMTAAEKKKDEKAAKEFEEETKSTERWSKFLSTPEGQENHLVTESDGSEWTRVGSASVVKARPETIHELHSSESELEISNLHAPVIEITPAEDALLHDADSSAFTVSDEIESLNGKDDSHEVLPGSKVSQEIEPAVADSAPIVHRQPLFEPQHPNRPYFSIIKQGPSPPKHVSFEKALAIAQEEEASVAAKDAGLAKVNPDADGAAATSEITLDDSTVSRVSPNESGASETTLDDTSVSADSSVDGKISDVSSDEGSVTKLTEDGTTTDASSSAGSVAVGSTSPVQRLATVVYTSPPLISARNLYTTMSSFQHLPGYMMRYAFQFIGVMMALTEQMSTLLLIHALPAGAKLSREAIGFVAEKAGPSIMEGSQVVLDAVKPAAKVVEDKTMKLIETAAEALARGLLKGAAQQGTETMGDNSVEKLGAYLQETLVAAARQAGAAAGAEAGKNTGREFAKAGLGELYHAADKAKGAARKTLAKMKTYIKPALMVAVPSFLLLLSLILLLSVLVGH
jgi:hypothetical protein